MTLDGAQIGSMLAAYSSAAPLLLFTDFSPDFAGGGAVILRSLLPSDPHPGLLWVSLSRAAEKTPGRFVPLSTGRFGEGGTRWPSLDATVFARALAREVLSIATEARAQALWVVLHGAGVPVAAELVAQKALPVHLTVHDDPPYAVALRSRRYLVLAPWLERCLDRALTGATSVDVISEGMRLRYQNRYGVPSFVVHRATSGPVLPSPPFDRQRGLRIGVLGNTYVYEQLPVLAKAVAQAASTLGVPGTLAFIGQGHAARLRQGIRTSPRLTIEDHGHLPEHAAIPLLREQFALYLNYPFGWRHAVLRQTSFPTKLSTYALASRPLLVHAPPDSSVDDLGPKPEYVLRWSSMSAEDGARALVTAWSNARTLESVHEPAEAVRLRYFDPERNRWTLTRALEGMVHPSSVPDSLDIPATVAP
jgi:hypothetical protein